MQELTERSVSGCASGCTQCVKRNAPLIGLRFIGFNLIGRLHLKVANCKT